MSAVHWEWTRGETIFAVLAMLVVAMSTFGVDRHLFRSKKRSFRPPDPRNYRIGYVIEEHDGNEDGKEENKMKNHGK